MGVQPAVRDEPLERERRVAVLSIDLQNDFCHPRGVFARQGLRISDLAGLVSRVNRVVGAARAGGHPVIWARMVWDRGEDLGLLASRSPFLRDEGLRRGTWGVEFLEDLDVRPVDLMFEKTRFSGFYNTELEALLEQHRIGQFFVTGVRTDFCVESTVRDAFFRDYEVAVVSDAVAGFVANLHEHSLKQMGTVFAELVTADEAASKLAGDKTKTSRSA